MIIYCDNVFQVPESRDEKVIDFKDLGWIVDFSLDSVVNLNLRKTDKENFAVFNEGNLYNNLFYKVNLLADTSSHTHSIEG